MRSRFLTAMQARRLDEDLMGPEWGFQLPQLMELAGLSVAAAAVRAFPPHRFPTPLFLCGKGNNGGDGLVAARHMVHFGYKPVLVCVDGDRFEHLGTQVRQLGVPVRSVVEEGAPTPQEWKQCSFVVDAIFGFGFHGVVRAPWRPIVEEVNESGKPVLCVDIPSGWHVEEGGSGSMLNLIFLCPALTLSLSLFTPRS